MRNLYVVYRTVGGEIEDEHLQMDGKINILTVREELRCKLSELGECDLFYKILSWQEEEAFTFEEENEFWKTFKNK